MARGYGFTLHSIKRNYSGAARRLVVNERGQAYWVLLSVILPFSN